MKLSKKSTTLWLCTSLFFTLNGCGEGETTIEKINQEKPKLMPQSTTIAQGKIETHGEKDGKTQIEKDNKKEENKVDETTKDTKMPHSMPATTAKELIPHEGIVLETLQADPYIYTKIEENGKTFWIAAPKTDIAVGAKVSFNEQMTMHSFTSKTLGRTFESVVFASDLKSITSSETNITIPTKKETTTLPANHPDLSKDYTADQNTTIQKMNKALQHKDINQTGSLYTVEQIYTQADDLNNTTISVKGKVIKVSEGIMGRNWIHIQDGTGSKGSDDLLFTSSETAIVGDEITATGTLKTNIDFGYGYAYSVLIENSGFAK